MIKLMAAIIGARIFQAVMYQVVHRLDSALVGKEPDWRHKVVDALWWLGW